MTEDSPLKAAKSPWRLLVSPAAFMRIALLVGFCSLLGFSGRVHWFLDLFNHLQAQYFVALLIISLVLAIWRKPVATAVAVLALMIPTARLAELYMAPIVEDDGTTLRVASFNVLGSNDRYVETVDWILQTDPDFIYLAECDAKWQQALKPLSDRYPFSADKARSGNLGYCFRSKYPIVSQDIPLLGKLKIPLLECVVRTPRGDITVFGAHPVPPVSSFWAKEQDIYLKELTRRCAETGTHAVILGDLNATRWSTQLQEIFNYYEDSANGHGYSATWKRSNWLVTIPIDHVLMRGFRGACLRRIGPELGSDHRPVFADLVW